MHIFKKMKHWNIDVIGYWVTSYQLAKFGDLKLESHHPKKFVLFAWLKIIETFVILPFKNDEKSCLFHFKSSFCPQDIQVFVTNLWSSKKMDWLGRYG